MHHDELLFITRTRPPSCGSSWCCTSCAGSSDRLAADQLQPGVEGVARVKHIQRTLTDQWAVLATLTPSEYAEFRGSLGTSSGFQSDQYRAVEFVLGNKNAELLDLFAHDERARALLAELLGRPSLYDEFLRYLARHGHAVPATLLRRDVTRPHTLLPRAGAGVPADLRARRPRTGRPTRPARSWSTWRRTSSSGGSGT